MLRPLLLLLTALLLFPAAAAAQTDPEPKPERPQRERAERERPPRERDPEARLERAVDRQLADLREHLGLTEAQVPEVRAIILEHRRALDRLRTAREEGADRQETRAAIRAQRESMDTALAAVLTPEQMTAYRALNQPERGEREGREEKQGEKKEKKKGGTS